MDPYLLSDAGTDLHGPYRDFSKSPETDVTDKLNILSQFKWYWWK